MMWRVPRIWDGGDVWILGGGPSVVKQFGIPDEVVQDVVNGTSPPSVYSPYMSAIHDKHVIGINVAYLIGNWIDMVFFGDSNFFHNHKVALSEFPNLKVSCHPQCDNVPWVKFTPRDGNRGRGISTHPGMVSWNGNSGAAAINLAIHTGAKRIILLGFDMNLVVNGRQHWHNLYPKKKAVLGKPAPGLPFHRHLPGFPVIAEDAKRLGVEIINANPQSEIDCFPKFSLKELLIDNS